MQVRRIYFLEVRFGGCAERRRAAHLTQGEVAVAWGEVDALEDEIGSGTVVVCICGFQYFGFSQRGCFTGNGVERLTRTPLVAGKDDLQRI
jgi:hypothetical protein